MKKKILTFIIGFLVGAIITTTGFLIYNKVFVNNNSNSEIMEPNRNRQMTRPSDGNMVEPPERLSGDNGETPPNRPDDNNNTEQSTNQTNNSNT